MYELQIDFSKLLEIAALAGLELLGCSPAKLDRIAAERLKNWQKSGYAGQMKWMNREAEPLADPSFLLSEAKTVISVAVAYDRRAIPKNKKGYGRVARYAWGKDYHLVLKDKVRNFENLLRQNYPDLKARTFSDAVPLLERAFAEKAGLGFIGKNTLLIRPKLGSFTFLADIVTDLEVINLPAVKIRSSCGSCTRCINNCPTSAFESEYILNANKCISYLTIEKRGELSEQERSMLGNWIFGCDVCQDVCPFNYAQLKQQGLPDIKEFGFEYGAGPFLSLEQVCSIRTDIEFREQFKDSPILRTKREGLIRNAICVAVNTDFHELLPLLKDLKHDSSDLIREFACWGFDKLNKHKNSI